jgi:hypothetical protein
MNDPISEIVLRKLQAYFPPDEVEWRVGPTNLDDGDEEGRGMALPYIPARRVQQRLDNVVGPFGWQLKFNEPVNKQKSMPAGVEASIGVRDPFSPDQWVWKADVSQNTQTEPMKGGYSKAVVRAGVAWGVGRYLYYIDQDMWVDVEKKYGSVQFKNEPDLPAEFRPENQPSHRFTNKQTRRLREACKGKSVEAVNEVFDEEKNFQTLLEDIQNLSDESST